MLNVKEAARYLGLAVDTVYRMAGSGRFNASRLVERCGSTLKRFGALWNSTRSKPLTEGERRKCIFRVEDGAYKIRWRKGGRNRSLTIHGPHKLAKKILRKKLSARDVNRHLDVRKEINFRMSALI